MGCLMRNGRLVVSVVALIFCFIVLPSYAGKLTIRNISNEIISCQIGDDSKNVTIVPNRSVDFYPSNQSGMRVINQVKCGNIEHHNIGVAEGSSDHFFIYNGKAKSVLSVLLYPYIPSYPYGDFSSLLNRVVSEFQAESPTISLNAVASKAPEYDIYTYDNYPKLLGKDGFDIVEVDAVLLQYLVDNSYIIPVSVKVDDFWPASIEGASYRGKTYGVPSWMCTEFLFVRDEKIEGMKSLKELVEVYLSRLSPDQPRLIGDFNGLWNMTAMYLDAYTDMYGYKDLEKIVYEQPKPEVVANLVYLTDQCTFDNKNNCTNLYYHNLDESAVPTVFAQNQSHAYVGFSESSFYTRLADKTPFYATPQPFGPTLNNLTYTDIYVANASRCSDPSCLENYQAFANYMSKVETRKWIAYSEDLASGLPPRRLLPAIKMFYQQKDLDFSDGIYEGFLRMVPTARAMPTMSKERRDELNSEICKIIQASRPEYRC